MTYLYFIQQGRGAIKIGVSDDPDERCRQLQTGTSKLLRVIARFPFENRAKAFAMEAEMHSAYAYIRGRGEWFKPRLIRELKVGGRRIVMGTHGNPVQRTKETNQAELPSWLTSQTL